MAGKRGLIMGVANDRSIAYGIARVLAGQGAEIAYPIRVTHLDGAAYHFAASGRWPDLQRVLEAHLQTIVASGAFSTAADYVRQFPEAPRSAAVEVVLSREATIEGDVEQVEHHARRAWNWIPPTTWPSVASLPPLSVG